ncbi:MAG: hypothetical protein GTN82_16940, partial [Candidatus Aminicenantes bacterium]|nr:hypothetical protein [Candidatus Aminicenantes bacterium]NIO85060.1 hypothetical protein [Candidatus Aminicenantes bacterium]NIR07106.1 hypothetical protein [Candidatus Aminicenantes bacterium]
MMKRYRRCLWLVIIVMTIARLLSAQADLIGPPKSINENTLKAHIRFLSDDLLGGRGLGSAGSSTAQLYIANQMQLMGLKGGFEGSSYYQKFDVIEINTTAAMKLKISGRRGEVDLKYYDEFIAVPGIQRERVIIDK